MGTVPTILQKRLTNDQQGRTIAATLPLHESTYFDDRSFPMHTFKCGSIASASWNRRWQVLDTLGWVLEEGWPGDLACNAHLPSSLTILRPNPPPWNGTLHSIVSSKVPKSFYLLRQWIQCVDERLITMRAKGHTLLICRNVPTYEVLLARARHHGVRTVAIHVSNHKVPMEKWLDAKIRLLQTSTDRFHEQCFVWAFNSEQDSEETLISLSPINCFVGCPSSSMV